MTPIKIPPHILDKGRDYLDRQMSHGAAPEKSFYADGILGDLQRNQIDPSGHKGISPPNPALRKRKYGVQDPVFRGAYDAPISGLSFNPIGAIVDQGLRAFGVEMPSWMQGRAGDYIPPTAAIESATTAGQNYREGDIAGAIGHGSMSALDAAATSLGIGAASRVAGFAPRAPGDAMNILGGAAVASALPGGGQTSTFIGQGAKNFPHESLDIARDIEKAGGGRDEVFQQTGLFRGADKKWRSEIDDRGLRISADNLSPGSVADLKGGSSSVARLQDIASHPAFDAEYPGVYGGVTDNGTMTTIGLSPTRSGGSYTPEREHIELGISKTKPSDELGFSNKQRSILGHETQHAVQSREGFASGGSPDNFDTKTIYNDKSLSDIESRTMEDIMEKYNIPGDGFFETPVEFMHRELLPDYGKLMTPRERRSLVDIVNEKVDKQLSPYDQYHNLAGEVEARNVQKRLDYTPEQRRMIPPWMTEDVPLGDQIVNFRGGGKSEMTTGGITPAMRKQAAKKYYEDNGVPPINENWGTLMDFDNLTLSDQNFLGKVGAQLEHPTARRRLEFEARGQGPTSGTRIPHNTIQADIDKLENKVIVPFAGDLTDTGLTHYDQGGVPIRGGVTDEGGAGFAYQREPEGLAWAGTKGAASNMQGAANLAHEATGLDPVFGKMAMGQDSLDFSNFPTISALKQMDSLDIPIDDMREFTRDMKDMANFVDKKGKRPYKAIEDFVGFDDPDMAMDQLLGRNGFPAKGAGAMRKVLMGRMKLAKWQNRGFPNYEKLKKTHNAEEFADTDIGDAGAVFMDAIPGAPIVDDVGHGAYPSGVQGKVIGGGTPFPPEIIWPDLVNPLGYDVRKHRSLSIGQEHQVVTPELLDRLGTYTQGSEGLTHPQIRSQIQDIAPWLNPSQVSRIQRVDTDLPEWVRKKLGR